MELKYNLGLFELMDFFSDTDHQGFSAEEVETAEKRLGISFPDMYRTFLLMYGKDAVTTHNNKLIEPKEIYISSEKKMQSTEEEYVVIWQGNSFVWDAGYLKKDLLDGVPNPPVFLSFRLGDEPASYTKCADDTEEFLFIMLRDAACGWHGGKHFKKRAEIERVLANAGIDQRRLQIPDASSTCLDGDQLYFYYESGSSRELYIANRTLPEHQMPGHRSGTTNKTEGQKSNATSPLAVEFSFGGDDWLQYNPRRAASVCYETKLQDTPQGGIPIHPWIAWMIQRYFNHNPSTAYDWGRDIERIKSLNIAPGFSRAPSEDEEFIYFWEPGYLPLPAPYYYDLHDWSVIGRMTRLQSLVVKGVYIDDFSFLRNCKNLKTLKLYKTNFSDCRLLAELQNLKEVHLIFCPLEHAELLQQLPVRCCTEGTIVLHPELKAEAIPVYKKRCINDKDIEELLKSDYCRFTIGNNSLKVAFAADRSAFISGTDGTGDYCYDNGSGNYDPVDLIVGHCPEERMMCHDNRVIRNIVYYFCCTSGCTGRTGSKNYVKIPFAPK